MQTKELIIVGGPNGAGKTTFANEYIVLNGHRYLGADAIASSLSPKDPLSARISASREFLTQVNAAMSASQSFVVESTLSGRTLQKVLRNAKTAQFEITIVYLFIDSVETCIKRIRRRVQMGGHDVPEPDIRRRFNRSIHNFWNLYRPLSDHWLLIDNTGNEPHDIAVGGAKRFSVRDSELYTKFENLIKME